LLTPRRGLATKAAWVGAAPQSKVHAIATSADRTAAIEEDGLAPGARVLAALAVVLQRHYDRSEVALGYLAADGSVPLPVRLHLHDDPSIGELLIRVRDAIERAAPATGGAGPRFDAVVAVGRDPPPVGWSPLWLALHRNGAGPDLVLHAESVDAGAGERLLGQVRTALASQASRPDAPASLIPILTEQETEQLLVEWNRTTAPYPSSCLHELLSAQAQRTPDAVAVRGGQTALTYTELDARANQLAHHLRGLGVEPEDLVAIAISRCAEMLIGLLGILKAGAAYVPVDPAYPAERQEFMLRSSGASVVVTEESLLASLPLQGESVVCLDRDRGQLEEHPTEAPAVRSDPEQLAYVIYTSGSTGQPKGVQIPHRALVNFLATMRERPGLQAEDVLVAVTTLSFDIAGLELYLPLLVGAQVVVAPAQTTSDPRALAELLSGSGATVMQATPTTWRMLLDHGWRPQGALKALCGGEALPVALSDRLVASGVELWNMYGPTETTIWSTCARITTTGESLTIGRPIANTTIYILDRHMQPVPVGVAGELWIGGDGLARGYRARDDLTQERFVQNPFGEGRIYRTGDLARYRPVGEIEFLGRIDNQVKVRGFRIELGEIETVLARHPGVAEAVVVARGAAGEDAELAAYVIPKGEPAPARELREHAGRTLPAYMIPSTVTTLDAFPLTPNGKVDRKALPEPARERSAERELVAPRTELERKLTGIWERQLQISPIGVRDDFFDLGVTSIVAAELFAAIEHELGSELPLGAIFQAPTIESLASLIESRASRSRFTSLVAVQPDGSRPPLFCFHGGAGTILHLADLSRRLGPDRPFYALQSRGLYGGAPPLTTVEEMATHYLSEMREVWPEGPWYLGGYCFGAIVAHEIATRLQAGGEEVKLLAIFNGPSPAWIKRWGWHGNQPSWLAKHPRAPKPSEEEQRRRRRAAHRRRLTRAVRDPRRLWTGLMWDLWEPRTRLSLALGRPIPEQLRERYFLELHAKAERRYEPRIYQGQILSFYGEGLYEDPTLGWEPYASEGMRSFAVPGEHRGNREAMHEPGVGVIAEHLMEYL
jgi:amino acid adenylation domain-containing protein